VQFDHATDVLVVGSGGGALASALTASILGAEALVVEKTELYGGTSANSGGNVWIPNSHHTNASPYPDSREKALEYLRASIGNTVPLAVTVESPMTAADHVRAIHVFTEKNPQPRVISVTLGPRAGRAHIATRARIADTGLVIAIAQMSDGSFWTDRVEVVVTLSACLEEGLI
jgi:NADPH-dependent 2,4-dienoyl-CoA reductase/sulfur reductase-like enzyme